jgi:tetratricopeptide (TPR) repeat protein
LDLARRARLASEQIRLLSALGTMAYTARQSAQASTFYGQALQVANERNDRAAITRLHGRMGQIAQDQRDFTSALDHYRRAVESAEVLENPGLLRRALSHLAAAQHRVGDLSAANSYRRALGLSQQLGERGAEALLRLNFGMLLAEQHQDSEALDNLYRAVTLSRDAGERGHAIAERASALIDQLGGHHAMRSRSWDELDEVNHRSGRSEWESERDRNDSPRISYGDQVYGEQSLPPE